LARRLGDEGYEITLDLSEGDTPEDRHIDVPPLSDTHLRTMLGAFVTTSVALIITKPSDWAPRKPTWSSRVRSRFGQPRSV